MFDRTLTSESQVNGIRSFVIENTRLRIVVLPEAGAKIWQVTHKPLNANLLWNNPALAPSPQPPHASYDDTWSGGWDELFPNDEACELHGLSLPDHGEFWTGAWTAHPSGPNRLTLRFKTPITRFAAEKELVLVEESAVLEVHYKLTNLGSEPFPFLWKLHPAFAVSAAHRIDFPPMTVVRELGFEGSLEQAPSVFAWPFAAIEDNMLDLRQVPDVSSKALHFFYGTEYTQGWCGITDRSRKLATALRFDPGIFTSCWLFATYGGWRDLNVAVLEPATGYPYQMQSMIDRGQARSLAPGETLETTVMFSVQEGLSSIGGVEADGTILPGDQA